MHDMLIHDMFVIVSINDILIYFLSEEKHASHLRIILQTLKDKQLFVKFSKCEFRLRSVTFFGYVVSSEGIQVDDQKIEVVQNWLRPTTLTYIRSLLDLVG